MSQMEHTRQVIELQLDIADEMERRYEVWMRLADFESRPRVRVILEKLADGAMDMSNEARADAKRLLRDFEEDGGVFKR